MTFLRIFAGDPAFVETSNKGTMILMNFYQTSQSSENVGAIIGIIIGSVIGGLVGLLILIY